jgi:hypothetical protein
VFRHFRLLCTLLLIVLMHVSGALAQRAIPDDNLAYPRFGKAHFKVRRRRTRTQRYSKTYSRRFGFAIERLILRADSLGLSVKKLIGKKDNAGNLNGRGIYFEKR